MKKWILPFIIVGISISCPVFGQSVFKQFVAVLDKAGMNFIKPVGMKETPLIRNDELDYQYAIKDSANNLEIRYLVYPLQDMVRKYNANQPDSGMPNIDPNFMHTNLLIVYSLKLQGKDFTNIGSFPEVKELPHATCEKEFNADWGGEINLQPCDEFAQKYKYCTLLEIHKDNIADAFIIFLYNRNDAPEDLLAPVLTTLKF